MNAGNNYLATESSGDSPIYYVSCGEAIELGRLERGSVIIDPDKITRKVDLRERKGILQKIEEGDGTKQALSESNELLISMGIAGGSLIKGDLDAPDIDLIRRTVERTFML